MAFSTVPLAMASLLGIISCIIAFIMAIVVVVKTLVFGESVAGFPTIICAIFLVGGLQLFCTGILGHYLAKTYLETKSRPIYITRETEEIYRNKESHAALWLIDKYTRIVNEVRPIVKKKQKAFDNAMVAIIVGIMMYVVAVLLRKGGF